MSEPTKKKMLELFDEMADMWTGDVRKKGYGMREEVNAIRAVLIESSDKGPEVDREWIEKWATRLKNDIDRPENYYKSVRFTMDNLCEMLHEAGVRVKEKK